MHIIKDQRDYIERRLSGEKVIPRAYLHGLTAVEKRESANEVMVISISQSDLSIYLYEIKDNNFRIISFQENVHHTLSEVLSRELLDEQTLAWWKVVFFEIEGQCKYDSSYDNLQIAENSAQTFKEIIQSVTQSLEELDIPKVPSTVCIFGEYSMNPLVRYVLQKKLEPHNSSIQLIPCEDIAKDTFDGSQSRIILPSEINQSLPMKINGLLFTDLVIQQPIPITFPMECIDNVLVNDISWSRLVSDRTPDYRVGNLEFKHLFLQADCDVYGDIFLSCEDSHGNNVIVKL